MVKLNLADDMEPLARTTCAFGLTTFVAGLTPSQPVGTFVLTALVNGRHSEYWPMFIEAKDLIEFIDRLGVFVFALSGGMLAVRHRMDLLGVMVISLFPAVCGGTLRDLLLGVPVFWLTDQASLILALSAGLAAFFFARFWSRLQILVWLDAAGLALFAAVGASKAYEIDGSFLVCVFMGAMTATAGGLIRDVVCNESPMLLREDVYATAAIIGASVVWGAREAGAFDQEALLFGAAAALVVRAFGIIFKLSLPRPPTAI